MQLLLQQTAMEITFLTVWKMQLVLIPMIAFSQWKIGMLYALYSRLRHQGPLYYFMILPYLKHQLWPLKKQQEIYIFGDLQMAGLIYIMPFKMLTVKKFQLYLLKKIWALNLVTRVHQKSILL